MNLRKTAANPLKIDEVRRIVQDYFAWEVVTNTRETILQALDIELRYKVSFWDEMRRRTPDAQLCIRKISITGNTSEPFAL